MTNEIKGYWLKIFESRGLNEADLTLFIRSIGFGIPLDELGPGQWKEVHDELEGIEHEGLLHLYLVYIRSEYAITPIEENGAHMYG